MKRINYKSTESPSRTIGELNFRPTGLLKLALLLIAAIFLLSLGAKAQTATTNLTTCYGGCTSNDFTVTEVYLSDANGNRITSAACITSTTIVPAYLSFIFRNNTNSDRNGIFLSANITVKDPVTNAVISTTPLAACFPGILTKKTATTKTYTSSSVNWPCGKNLVLDNTFVGWGSSGENVCTIRCAEATPSKCRTLGTQIVNTPLMPDFTYSANCAANALFQSVSFDAAPTTGGFHNYVYAWNFGEPSSGTTNNTSTLKAPSHTFASAGTFTVSLKVTDTQYLLDASGNPTATVVSTQNQTITKQVNVAACCSAPTVNTSPANATKCAGENATFSATFTGGSPTPGIQWQLKVPNGSFTNLSDVINSISGSSTGTLTLTGVTTSLNGNKYRAVATSGSCSSATSLEATLSVDAPPTAATGGNNQNICGLLVSNALGGNTPGVGTGAWSVKTKPNGSTVQFSSAAGNTTATVSATGTYVFTWTISNGVCTASVADITVNYYPTPPLIASVTDQPTCAVQTGTITVSSNITGLSFSINSTSDYSNTTGVFSGLAPENYTIRARNNSTGCIAVAGPFTVNAVPGSTPTPVVVVTSYPDCSSSTGSLEVKYLVSNVPTAYSSDYEFKNDGFDLTNWQNSATFTFTPGKGYNIKVRRKADTTCERSVSCNAENTSNRTGNNVQSTETQINAIDKKLKAYPIPFYDKVTLKFTSEKNENYVVNLYDLRGNLVKQLKAGNAKAGEITVVEMDGRKLSESLYIARKVSRSGVETVKLLKSK
jgi:hypothetical protein